MTQIFILHGGDTYSSYESYLESLKSKQLDYERLKPRQSWKHWLAQQMPEHDVLLPSFPNSDNASYEEWKIVFEKLLPFFKNDVRLVGHSLGAMFLTKYLQDHPLRAKVRQLVLIAGGYDDESREELGDFRITSATNLPQSAEEIYIFHSQDDPVVPFSELRKFQADLPQAIICDFTDKGHFLDTTFPELLNILKQK